MAITFTDHSINGKILNAFNNNVVRFGSNATKVIVDAGISVHSKNLFNNDTILAGKYLYTEGAVYGGLGNNASYFVTDYIEIGATGLFSNKVGQTTSFLVHVYYDENKEYLDSIQAANQFIPHISGAKYVRFSYLNTKLAGLQIESGNVGTSYENYFNASFNITPSPLNQFYFNFKTAVKKLINKASFTDDCQYPAVGSIWNDNEAYLSAIVNYKVNFEDATNETATFTYQFVKGVNQITEKAFFANRGVAFPLHKPIDNVSYVALFKGYPFDISLFGEDISITIDQFLSEAQFLAHDLPALEVDPEAVNFSNDIGVQRLIFSNGSTLWSKIFDKYHNIRYGNYEVRMRVEDKCGVYFKWHNEYGGWDYWLFEKNYHVDMKDKQLGEIVRDFDNLPDSKSFVESTGKSVEDSMKLYANGVYDYEIERVLGIARSPKVYMYFGEKDEQNNDDNWVEVQVSASNPDYKANTFRKTIAIKVTVPSNYTLTL